MEWDEIGRTLAVGGISAIAIVTGFGISWLVNKDHIRDLQEHVRDLKEAIFALLPKSSKRDDDGDDTRL